MVKICILIPDFTICSGANTQSLHLAQTLKNLSAQPFLVFGLNAEAPLGKPCHDNNFLGQLGKSGIPFYQKPENLKKKWESYKYFYKFFFDHREDFQLVYINGMSNMICWFVLFFKLLGKKVVIKMTGIGINDPLTLEKLPAYNRLLLKILYITDKFVGTSTALCESYRNSYLFPQSKLVQIPNGVNTDLFSPLTDDLNKKELKKRLGIPVNDKIVTYIGSVRRGKGIDLLFNCWEQVLEKHPDATLLVVGPLCPLCPAVRLQDKEFVDLLRKKVGIFLVEDKEVVKMLILSKPKNKIQLLGTKNNIYEYLQASDLFVFLSRSEGMPNALMEAMASGLPSVTLDIDEISRDLITGNEYGHKIEGENLIALVSSISDLLSNPEKCSHIGKASREKILKEFKIEEIAQKHLALYRELLDKS
ncbi:MAG: glycosyltransferase family 4 protein [Candidatus Schekmanbacteria bacterium]|nr:glycosyltransferase family 4 protein [Candidatus Schekmanbacteria bacterium]